MRRIAGGDERLASVDEIPIRPPGQESRIRYIVEQWNRVMLFALGVVGLISAACVSGLPSATCYALADAYTITLQRLAWCLFGIIIGYKAYTVASGETNIL